MVVIVTDDQPKGLLDAMPNTRKLLVNMGVNLQNGSHSHFALLSVPFLTADRKQLAHDGGLQQPRGKLWRLVGNARK